MDLNFTDEQRLLADSTTRFLEQTRDFHARRAQLAEGVTLSSAVWGHLAGQGLLALPRSEAAGGPGGSIVDLVAIAMRFGASLLTEPYLATVVLAGAALEAAGGDEARTLLTRIATGEAVVGFAHEEAVSGAPVGQIETTAIGKHGGYVLSGLKPFVLAGGDAEELVVSARHDDGIALFLVDAATAGIMIEKFVTVDGRGAGRVRFDDVHVPQAALLARDATSLIDDVVADALLYLAAESVGAMDALFRMTSSYAATRQQFGVPIGSFQTIAHRLADMKIALTKAHASLIYVTALREAGQAGPADLSVLKAQTGRLGRTLAEAAVQTHGGVGMTDELAVGHLLKRILANDSLFGDAELHLRLLGSKTGVTA
ncbi:MAG TPA: acyl-CoA dehydrogenase family protein [Mycobacteriales bacterium]|nr:acyl-CoA dehydrogenase family protein [Mycobacteriales bacterium]